jgi:ribosome-associated protein
MRSFIFKEDFPAAPLAPVTTELLVETAVQTIAARKGLEPVLLEVKDLCSFADYFLICSGASKRQVLALADYIREALSKVGVKPLGVEGMEEGLWVLLDYNSLVIHIFYEPLREFYNLEGLWADAPKTPIDTEKYPQPAASIANQE